MLQDVEDNSSVMPVRPTSKRPRSKRHDLVIQKSMKTSLDISTLPDKKQPEHKECRICLDETQTSENPFLTPCKCQGSVKYVHDGCYRKWLQRLYRGKDKKQQEDIMANGVQCELCKEKILLNFDTTRHCASCKRINQKISKNKSLFALFLVFIILNSATLSYLLYYTFSNVSSLSTSVITLSLVIGSFIFLGLTLILTLFYFIADYFVDKTWALISFQLKKTQKRKPSRRYQIAPMSVEELDSP